MPRWIAAMVFVLAAGVTAADDPGFDCEIMTTAYENLERGCFTAQRELRITLNDKLRVHEFARIDYRAGKLEVDILERPVDDKNMGAEGDSDMALSIPFSCATLAKTDDHTFELTGTGDPERVTFDYRPETLVLMPRRWFFETTERFLFRKFRIHAEAVYSDVEYTGCVTSP